jgi:glutathione transport system substrate-binding protein
MQVQAPDPQTLVITYDTPVRSSFDVFALTFMADPQTFTSTAAAQSFVGTGPFRFKEWVQGDHLSVVRNPDYWQAPKPYLDGVELTVRPDPVAAVAVLEAGSVDWVVGAPSRDARRLQNDANYTVLLHGNGGSFYCVGLDCVLRFSPTNACGRRLAMRSIVGACA